MYEAFITVLIIGCVILFANLVYASLQKPSTMQIHVIVALVCVILMFTGYYIELRATSLDMALMGTVVAYLGKPFIMLHCMLIICAFYGFKVPRLFYYIASSIGAIIFLAVFTNPLTNLYYTSFTFDVNNVHAPLLMVNGPLYLLHAGTMIGYFIGCVIISIKGYRKYRTSQNASCTIYLILMVLFGILGYVVYLTGLSKGYDATVFGALGGIICLSILFYKYRLFDAVTVAKDYALDNSVTGIIVIDSNGIVSYVNQTGNGYLEEAFSIEMLLQQSETTKKYQLSDATYNVTRKEIENRGKKVCTAFEITDITASADYQFRLEKEVKERTDKIEIIQRKTIASLASVVEARSLETGQHIVRTSEYTRITASALKEYEHYKDVITDKYIDLLSDVTPLHDVGKISIPDNILLKPGKLDEKEFEEMKKHAEIGAEIIEKTMRGVEDDSYVNLAVKVALYHHERWDGTGYPKGLKGEEIPLEARIMAIADCFDALVSERCYKDALPVEKAIEIIKSESGTHFDPDVVNAFLDAYVTE